MTAMTVTNEEMGIGGMEELLKTVEERARAAERDEILVRLREMAAEQRLSEFTLEDAVADVESRGAPLTYSRNELGRVMSDAGGDSGWQNMSPALRERYCSAAEAVATYVGAKVTDITVVADPGSDASSD